MGTVLANVLMISQSEQAGTSLQPQIHNLSVPADVTAPVPDTQWFWVSLNDSDMAKEATAPNSRFLSQPSKFWNSGLQPDAEHLQLEMIDKWLPGIADPEVLAYLCYLIPALNRAH